jgi:hypothetical protein
MFGFSRNDDGSQNHEDNIPFALKFMSAISAYLESNSRFKQKALIELYQLQRQLAAQMDTLYDLNGNLM